MPSVSFHTLGCKLNFTETGTIARSFVRQGYDVLPFGTATDVTVINTCTVTEEANRKCRQVVRRATRKNPDAFVIVTGCYAQLQPEEIACIDGVDLVLGANEKFHLFSIANTLRKNEQTQVQVSCIDNIAFSSSYASEQRTRAFLKIQDGCDYSCSFCTIPMARGASRSARIDDVIEQAYEIADTGAHEIVLSGVNIGLFGADTGEDLLSLLVKLDDVSGIERFRISSIEPNLLADEIIDFVAGSKRFMPHFHMPLQSGDDQTLGRMRRRYKRDVYEHRVERIKSLLPDACIGADVIVGFPGSTESNFGTTVEFLRSVPLSYLHVFTYSERPDTVAADELTTNETRIHPSERSRRNKVLRTLSERMRTAFYTSLLGQRRTVLWETGSDTFLTGYTDNYVRVRKPFVAEDSGRVESVVLDSLSETGMVDVRADHGLAVLQ